MMETKEQKPWYQGHTPTVGSQNDALYVILGRGEASFWICRMMEGDHETQMRWANLFAAAPAIAEQRDWLRAQNASLLSVQKQLVEALADCKWLFEQDELKPLMSGRWGDPSVVADKVNLAILAAKASIMKNAIRKLEAFAGGSLVQIGKGLLIVALAYPIIWLALVVLNS